MKCIFPLIKASIEEGNVSVGDFIVALNLSEDEVLMRLSGEKEFDINEAMNVNKQLFPDVPFEKLFSK
ncbi:MAG: hypothetical protein IIU14_02280 [Ruminococcus sp.]|nr:hypothetical protein [Ruminococcus sp.]